MQPHVTTTANDIEWDAALIARYSRNGPRYTSYPTALNFDKRFKPLDHIGNLQELGRKQQPLSLYFHIPFCHQICYYCGCNKIVTKSREPLERYLKNLKTEITLVAKALGKRQGVSQLHFGGGTPTFLTSNELSELIAFIGKYFDLNTHEKHEYAIEIDPRSINCDTLSALRNTGFNRLSFGVQDTNPDVQTAINRLQSTEHLSELVHKARELDYQSISFDLIYGLPLQTIATLSKTLEDVITLRPDRISLYHYAHLPERFKSQRAIDRLTLPSSDEKVEMLSLAAQRLQKAGYVYIGMDHFALPEDELARCQREGRLLRNFQGYSTGSTADVIGLGVSAISAVGRQYAQNHKDIGDYYLMIEAGQLPVEQGLLLNDDDCLRRYIIMQLACNLRLDYRFLNLKFNANFSDKFAHLMPALLNMQGDGIVELTNFGMSITDKGRMLIRNICMLFDNYLSDVSTKYSKTL